MAFCAQCGTQLPDNAVACSTCGRSTAPLIPPSVAATGGLTDNVAGMLAYITIIPAIIFLVTAPYNRNRFIRFHSFQSLFFCVAVIIVELALNLLTVVPILLVITIPIQSLIGLAVFVLWIVMLLKAYQGQMWKLPIVGDLAEKQAAAA